jgi:hypothetical protein
MKSQNELKSMANNFVLTLNRAGYKFDHSTESLKYIELAIDGLKDENNSAKAIKAAYIYFALYISEIFIKTLPRFQIKLQFKNEEINEVCVTDGKSTIYFLTWMYQYMQKPKKEGIFEKYHQTLKILSGKPYSSALN